MISISEICSQARLAGPSSVPGVTCVVEQDLICPGISFQRCPCFSLVRRHQTTSRGSFQVRARRPLWTLLSRRALALPQSYMRLRSLKGVLISNVCSLVICIEVCASPPDRHAHTKRVHISMLSWVCERQLGVNCARVWRNED